MNLNAPSSRFGSWLDNPCVFSAIQGVLKLAYDLFQVLQNTLDLLFGILLRNVLEVFVSFHSLKVPRIARKVTPIFAVKCSVVHIVWD